MIWLYNAKTSQLDKAVLDTALFAGLGDLFKIDVYINWNTPDELDKKLDTPLDEKPVEPIE